MEQYGSRRVELRNKYSEHRAMPLIEDTTVIIHVMCSALVCPVVFKYTIINCYWWDVTPENPEGRWVFNHPELVALGHWKVSLLRSTVHTYSPDGKIDNNTNDSNCWKTPDSFTYGSDPKCTKHRRSWNCHCISLTWPDWVSVYWSKNDQWFKSNIRRSLGCTNNTDLLPDYLLMVTLGASLPLGLRLLVRSLQCFEPN